MIVWRGMGILALLVAVLINVSLNEAANAWLGVPEGVKHYRDVHPWVWWLGMGLSAVACWYLGRWLEARELKNAKVVTEQATGQTLHLISRHDLFWIPVKWWSVVWLLVGLVLSFR